MSPPIEAAQHTAMAWKNYTEAPRGSRWPQGRHRAPRRFLLLSAGHPTIIDAQAQRRDNTLTTIESDAQPRTAPMIITTP
ncbi:MAG: hypothetical protein ACO4BZ_09970, partial [Ilumatobacteraceae bacterium]